MEAYKERVIAEKVELDGKIEKLRGFIGSEVFDVVSLEEQKRMRRQELIMQLYSDVLEERIVAFK